MFNFFKHKEPQPLQCNTCQKWQPLRRFPGWRRIPGSCRTHLCREILVNEERDIMCKECLATALKAQFNITKPEHVCCPVATCRQVWSTATVLKCLGKDSEGRRRQHEYNGLRAYRQMQERVAGSKGLQHIDRRAKDLSYNSVVIIP